VLAPLAVMVKDCPLQMLLLFTLIVGRAFTVIELIAVLLLTQPREFVPVTFIVVLVVGATIALPLEYVYVLAPPGVIVNDFPLQMVPLDAEITGPTYAVTVLPDVTPPGLTQLEVVPLKAKLVSVPVILFAEASVNVLTVAFAPPDMPWLNL
jgi:hypothetical protein